MLCSDAAIAAGNDSATMNPSAEDVMNGVLKYELGSADLNLHRCKWSRISFSPFCIVVYLFARIAFFTLAFLVKI